MIINMAVHVLKNGQKNQNNLSLLQHRQVQHRQESDDVVTTKACSDFFGQFYFKKYIYCHFNDHFSPFLQI